MLEAAEQIERFKEFFEAVYNKELLEAVSAGKTSLHVDFAKFSAFDPRLAVDLLESPEEAIKAAELSIRETELPTEIKSFRIRVHNIPESQKMMIREIRSNHIGKLMAIEGIIRRKSDVRPQVVNTRFESPNCGNRVRIVGILKEVPVVKHGSRLTNFDLHIDTNYIETIDEDFYEIKISKDDEADIFAVAKDKK